MNRGDMDSHRNPVDAPPRPLTLCDDGPDWVPRGRRSGMEGWRGAKGQGPSKTLSGGNVLLGTSGSDPT